MKISDRAIGFIAILAGMAIIYGTLEFRSVPGQQFGSAFFPIILGTVAICVGITQMLLAKTANLVEFADWMKGPLIFRGLSVVLASFLWLLASDFLGFILSTTLLIFGISLAAGGKPYIAALVGLGMTTILYIVFGSILRVPLPHGIIENAIL